MPHPLIVLRFNAPHMTHLEEVQSTVEDLAPVIHSKEREGKVNITSQGPPIAQHPKYTNSITS